MKQEIPKLLKQYARIVSLVLFAWVSIGPVQNLSGKLHKVENQAVIRVAVYNYADVAPLELLQAERKAAALFAEANVQIVWSEHSRKSSSNQSRTNDSPPHFFVRILYALTILRLRRISGPDVLGESIIPAGTNGPLPGGIANVFYDRVRDSSSARGQSSGALLGEAIAHELGHLLLGPRHSHQGIMKAHWTLQDMAQANRGALQFSPGQVAAVQRAARSLHNNPSLTVTARR